MNAASATPILECRNLSISYGTRRGDVPAVVDFNLRLMPGEAHGLVGESGCGKSTIALAIMRYLGRAGRVVGGEILFDGRDLLALPPQALRRIRGAAIAMIYQEPMASLNPAMPVGAQLIEVPVFHEGLGNRAAQLRARDMLERVRLADIDRIMRSYPHQISGGQQQRVVIAMALLSQPRLLLLDEPTTALDVTVEAGIVDLIRDISTEFGTSMLYISHNLGLILETCVRITVMYSGEAVETGPVATVFGRMRHPYTRGLFASIPVPAADKELRPLVPIPGQLPAPQARPPGCNFGPRCRHFVAAPCGVRDIPMLELSAPGAAIAHAVRCARLDEIGADEAATHEGAAGDAGPTRAATGAPARPGSVTLEVRAVTRRYGRVVANDRLTFDAHTGETVALVGESGCGKSTFAKLLMGLEQPSSGSIKLDGLELAALPVARRSTQTIRNLQMVFQNPFDTLNPSLSVGAQIGRVIRKFGIERDRTRVRERVLALLDTVKLPRELADRLPGRLSGGQKQRVGIARAFAGNPGLVVADEPVSALDVSVQAAVTELLLQIQRREHSTLLFISHDLSVVRYLADRIIVMYLGRIMEQGSTTAIFAPPYHPYTEALLSAVPVADPRVRKRRVRLTGEMPSADDPPAGCPFCTRCAYSIPGTCAQLPPPLHEFEDDGRSAALHTIACHLPRAVLLDMQPIFGLPS